MLGAGVVELGVVGYLRGLPKLSWSFWQRLA